MKEKTFKDLGLDEGDKFVNKILEEYDLGNLGSIDRLLNKPKNEENSERI